MADIFSPEKRSEIMSRIGGKNTKPEMVVRKGLHSLGYRYRLHVKDLPGKPDMCFSKYNAVIEINGCYWHGHECHLFRLPKSNTEFWKNKIGKNKDRDERNVRKLRKLGYRVLIVWECAIKGKTSYDPAKLIQTIEDWLTSGSEYKVIEGEN